MGSLVAKRLTTPDPKQHVYNFNEREDYPDSDLYAAL